MLRLLGLFWSLTCSTLYAGDAFIPKFSEEPFIASTFWGAAVPILTSFATSEALGGADNTSETFDGTSQWSKADQKMLHHAQDDAASFIATDGAIHSARLQAAFNRLRQKTQWAMQDDAQLAFRLIAKAY